MADGQGCTTPSPPKKQPLEKVQPLQRDKCKMRPHWSLREAEPLYIEQGISCPPILPPALFSPWSPARIAVGKKNGDVPRDAMLLQSWSRHSSLCWQPEESNVPLLIPYFLVYLHDLSDWSNAKLSQNCLGKTFCLTTKLTEFSCSNNTPDPLIIRYSVLKQPMGGLEWIQTHTYKHMQSYVCMHRRVCMSVYI